MLRIHAYEFFFCVFIYLPTVLASHQKHNPKVCAEYAFVCWIPLKLLFMCKYDIMTNAFYIFSSSFFHFYIELFKKILMKKRRVLRTCTRYFLFRLKILLFSYFFFVRSFYALYANIFNFILFCCLQN